MKVVFDGKIAPYYEAWFETEEGRHADELEKALLSDLLNDLGEPGRMLEVGCGTGHFSRWFATLGWEVTGLDISPPMLAEAKKSNFLELILGEATRLPFPVGSWDVVALITILEFLTDSLAALGEALRVARRGILVGCINRHSLLGWSYRRQARKAPSVYGQARFYSTGELRSLLRKAAGARPLELRERTTLWPGLLPLECSSLPWGGFVGMRALL